MKCTFIASSICGRPDDDFWFNTIKKITRQTTKSDEWPTLEEDKAAQKRIGSLSFWNLTDGTILLYVKSNEKSLGQEFEDQGYFILSDFENLAENELKKSFEEMENDCLSENGFVDKIMAKRDYNGEARDKLKKHIECMHRSLDLNALTILEFLKGNKGE